MGFFDRFKKRDDSYKREKVIEVITNILKDIHLKNYEDIKNYVDEFEIDDLNEFFGYVEKTLELNDFDRLMNMEWHVISIHLMSILNWKFMIIMTILGLPLTMR